MRRIRYRKLIRDRIPETIAAAGARCRLRRLSRRAFVRALREKLCEEVLELRAARDRSSVLNELIDIQELVDTYRRTLGVSPSRFRAMVERKRRRRGGFRKRLFLEYTEEADN